MFERVAELRHAAACPAKLRVPRVPTHTLSVKRSVRRVDSKSHVEIECLYPSAGRPGTDTST
jgi:hypothetical protein